MKYFDVHSHIFPENIAPKVIHELETYYGYKWAGTGLEEDLVGSLLEAGVARSVIFSSATKSSQVRTINNYIASLQNKYPHLFFGFGTLHQDFDDFAGEIARMKKLGLHGLKFHPDFQRFHVDEPKIMRIYREIGDSLPLLFHIGDRRTEFSSPARLAKVLKELPRLRVIAAHMGGYSEWEEAWKHLIGKNIWLDISSTIDFVSPKEARRMVLAHGVDKVLFASDYPAVRHKKAIGDVLRLELGDEANEMIFHGNAERLFGVTL